MNVKTMTAVLAALGVLAGGGYAVYQAGVKRGMQASEAPAGAPQKPGDIDPANGKRVLYWHDPMAPTQKFDRPGKSPFMDMQLVPVYEEGTGSGVAVDPRMRQSLGMRTIEASKTSLTRSVEAVGSVAYNERDVAVVQARSNGFVEKLHVRAPLDPVKKGEPLADLYSPDWVAAQEEYLSSLRLEGTRVQGLVEGARQRMRLAGMNEEQIKLVERTGKLQPRLTVYSPRDGVVAELGAREGMTVAPGAMLFRINGLGTVWINAEVRESDAAAVRVGNEIKARAAALPGKEFAGRVNALLPEVNPATRTLKARVEVANPHGELKPGMFATVIFTEGAAQELLAVPSETLIHTGKRTVVIVAQADGKFAPVEVETGVEANGFTEIVRGIEAGQKVVVSGQFLIDSEASLRATETRMGEAAGTIHKATGRLEAIGKDEITISHDPIASLRWPAMTMDFKAPPLPKELAVGDRVEFELRQLAGGEFEIASIRKAAR
ncbi:MAG TPA: efflux RND transporter periplasmic adaptor subunit [Burkholderiales bacterium]|nr:efflux RND transporter periplasmic adaptor subunit [Burkholderiales bacterium]